MTEPYKNTNRLNSNQVSSDTWDDTVIRLLGRDTKVGLFEAAGGGFVFLDEIGDMPMSQQPKLLRAIQERRIVRVGEVDEKSVNFRTISATHQDLRKAISEGRFREDLFYRISKAVIQLPSLKERMCDIPELVQHFLFAQGKKYSITDEALNLLQSFDWPGNVRQLESAVEGMVIRTNDGVIRVAQVVQAVPELAGLSSTKIKKAVVGSYGMQLIARERSRFERAIIEANGDRTEAAKILGLPRTTFFRKAKELGLVRSRTERSLGNLRGDVNS